jgi:hypothetical protein
MKISKLSHNNFTSNNNEMIAKMNLPSMTKSGNILGEQHFAFLEGLSKTSSSPEFEPERVGDALFSMVGDTLLGEDAGDGLFASFSMVQGSVVTFILQNPNEREED